MRRDHTPAFTLLELLITVAIIAILAAIAVPNFVEAQVRAKVSRARADLRTYATAIEAYAVDHNFYPPNASFLAPIDLAVLSTPTAYLTTAGLRDPFGTPQINAPSGQAANSAQGYAYVAYNTESKFYEFEPAACSAVPRRGWSVVSQGPNTTLDGAASLIFRSCPAAPGPYLADLRGRIYDPTNGTVSRGDIIRFGGDIPPVVSQGTG